MRDVQLGQVYRHFKGDYYLVEALARDSETNEPCVIYRKLYGDGGLWVRPLDEFLSEVDRAKYPDAAQRYRFVFFFQFYHTAFPAKNQQEILKAAAFRVSLKFTVDISGFSVLRTGFLIYFDKKVCYDYAVQLYNYY